MFDSSKIWAIWVLLFVFSLASLTGCGVGSVDQQTKKPAKMAIQVDHPRKLVLRLCSSLTDSEVTRFLGRHRLNLLKKPSPVILSVEWQDARPFERVIAELDNDPIVCGVQPEYFYGIERPSD